MIAPDVGGGFGYKGVLLGEEVALAWAARKLGQPLRWIEDRRENLTAGANCREHHYRSPPMRMGRGACSRSIARRRVDAGAYSAYPFSACLEAGQIGSILPGLYDFAALSLPHLLGRDQQAADPALSRRRAHRRLLRARGDARCACARELGIEPANCACTAWCGPSRCRSTISPSDISTAATIPRPCGVPSPPIGLEALRERQRRGEPDGRLLGVGIAMYSRAGRTWHERLCRLGHSLRPRATSNARRASRRMAAWSCASASHSHGQGLETTLSQVAHAILGVPHDRIKLSMATPRETPYSTGTWGSRSHHVAGGAVAEACEQLAERVKRIGASLLQARPEDVRLESGDVVADAGRISVAEIARTWYRRPQELPPDVDPGGLEVTAGYKAKRDTGTFSYAAHAAVVAVDPENGRVEILDYVIVEDGGVLVNPMIVDGQIYGGAAQGIGTALYEEMRFNAARPAARLDACRLSAAGPDRSARRSASSTWRRRRPTRASDRRASARAAPSRLPAAITNAINDALKGLGAELLDRR